MQDIRQKQLKAKIAKSQQEGALNPGYWYKDNDCDSYIEAAIRAELGGLAKDKAYLLQNTYEENGQNWHVLITPAVNGQVKVPRHALGIDYFLDRNKQANTILAIYQKINERAEHDSEGKFRVTDDLLYNIVGEYEGNEETVANIVGVLWNCNFNSSELNEHIALLEEYQNRDVFDEINDVLLSNGQKQHFKILFPCNLGRYNTSASFSGSHWILDEIQVVKQTDNSFTVTVFGHDPLGGNGLSDENFQKIKATVLKRLNDINSSQKNSCVFAKSAYKEARQKGGVDCGVYTDADLVRRAKGQDLTKYKENPQELRNHQFAITHSLSGEEKLLLVSKPTYARNITNRRGDTAAQSSRVNHPVSRPLPSARKAKPKPTMQEKSKRDIGFVYHQLLEVRHKFDEKVEAKWMHLHRVLAELKTTEEAFSQNAVLSQHFLQELIDLDIEGNVLSVDEKAFLQEAIKQFKEIVACSDVYPEIDVNIPEKSNPSVVLGRIDELHAKIFDTKSNFSKRVDCCARVTAHYSKLQATVTAVKKKYSQKGITCSQTVGDLQEKCSQRGINLSSSSIQPRNDLMSSLITPVQRLPRIELMVKNELKPVLDSLGQSLETIDEIRIQCASNAKIPNQIIKVLEESNRQREHQSLRMSKALTEEERIKIRSEVIPEVDPNVLLQTARTIGLKRGASSKVQSDRELETMPFNSITTDEEAGTPTPLTHQPASLQGSDTEDSSLSLSDEILTNRPPERVPSPVVKITVDQDKIAKPLSYADKAFKAMPEDQRFSTVIEGLQGVVRELSVKETYPASDFERLSKSLADIEVQMKQLDIGVPDQATIQKIYGSLDNPLLGFVYAQLCKFARLYQENNLFEAEGALQYVWAAFQKMDKDNCLPYRLFDPSHQPIEQVGASLSPFQQLFNEAYKCKGAIQYNGIFHDNRTVVYDLARELYNLRKTVNETTFIPDASEVIVIRNSLVVEDEEIKIEESEAISKNLEAITDPEILRGVHKNLVSNIFRELVVLNVADSLSTAEKKQRLRRINYMINFMEGLDKRFVVLTGADSGSGLMREFEQNLINCASAFDPEKKGAKSQLETIDGSILLHFICVVLPAVASSSNSVKLKPALQAIWKAFYCLQMMSETTDRPFRFFDMADGCKPLKQEGGNLSFAQELFNAVFYMLRQNKLDQTTLINLRGILSKQVEYSRPISLTQQQGDSLMEELSAVTFPMPSTTGHRASEATKLHTLGHNDLEDAVLKMIERIVAGYLVDPAAQQKWIALFNENKIESRADWTFEQIQSYFRSHNTYQAQHELVVKFAAIFRSQVNLTVETLISQIESDFISYFMFQVNERSRNETYDSEFFRCPAIKKAYEKICNQFGNQGRHPLLNGYFNALKGKHGDIFGEIQKLTERNPQAKAVLNNAAQLFIQYVDKKNASIGSKAVGELCQAYGFTLNVTTKTEREGVESNPSSLDKPLSYYQVHRADSVSPTQPNRSEDLQDLLVEWKKEAPSRVGSEDGEIAGRVTYPSMYVANTEIQYQENGEVKKNKTAWVFDEPENKPAGVINVERVATELYGKIMKNDATGSKVKRMVVKALLDFFEEYASQGKSFQKGEVNEEFFRTAYLAYQQCRSRGERFSFDKTTLNQVINWYLTHIADGFLPLTDSLIVAWKFSLGKECIIWKKERDNNAISPCKSSLSKDNSEPSVHILETKDQAGNTIFKEMKAEKAKFLEHENAPVYIISGSNVDVPEGAFLDRPQLINNKMSFYGPDKILDLIYLGLHYRTSKTNKYWYVFAPGGDKYGTEIERLDNLIEKYLYTAIQSLEVVALSSDLVSELLFQKQGLNTDDESARRNFARLLDQYKTLLKVYKILEPLGHVGSDDAHPEIEQAKALIEQMTGMPYSDPYAVFEDPNALGCLKVVDSEGTLKVRANLEYSRFTVDVEYNRNLTKKEKIIYTVHHHTDEVSLLVASDAEHLKAKRSVAAGLTGALTLGFALFGGLYAGKEIAINWNVRADDVWEYQLGAGLILPTLNLICDGVTYYLTSPKVWVKEYFNYKAGKDVSRVIVEEYTEFLPAQKETVKNGSLLEAPRGLASMVENEDTSLSGFHFGGPHLGKEPEKQSVSGRMFAQDQHLDSVRDLEPQTSWYSFGFGGELSSDSDNDMAFPGKTGSTFGIMIDMESSLISLEEAQSFLLELIAYNEAQLTGEMVQKLEEVKKCIAGNPEAFTSNEIQMCLVALNSPHNKGGLIEAAKLLTKALQELNTALDTDEMMLPKFDFRAVKVVDGRNVENAEMTTGLQWRYDKLKQKLDAFTPTAKPAIKARFKDQFAEIEELLKQDTISEEKLGVLLSNLEKDPFLIAATPSVQSAGLNSPSNPLYQNQNQNPQSPSIAPVNEGMSQQTEKARLLPKTPGQTSHYG